MQSLCFLMTFSNVNPFILRPISQSFYSFSIDCTAPGRKCYSGDNLTAVYHQKTVWAVFKVKTVSAAFIPYKCGFLQLQFLFICPANFSYNLLASIVKSIPL